MPTKMVRVFSSVDAICIYLSLIQGSCIEVTCGLICFCGYVMGMQINAPGSACALTQACPTVPSILLAILLHN